MYGYIYKTIFPDGKLYIGQSARYVKFNPNYHGSGVVIKKFYKNHSPNELVTELIEWCEDKNSLDKREIFWIKELNSLEPFGHNISIGGNGGNLGEEVNNRLKELNQSNRMHGKRHSINTRKIMSEKAKLQDKSYLRNYMFITNGIETRKVLKSSIIPDGFHKGRTLSTQTLEKMKLAGKRKTDLFLESKKKQELEKYGYIGLSKSEKISITINKLLSEMSVEERKQKFGRPMSEDNKKKLAKRMIGNKYKKK